MSISIEVVEAEDLKLGSAERSRLLEKLITSLDADQEVEAAWELEVDRREAELEAGTVRAWSGQEAIGRLRTMLGE